MSDLIKLDRARQTLADCRTLSDVKVIRDKAAALKEYARAQQLGGEARNYASEIVLLASRKMGELLKESAEKGERDSGNGGDRKSQSCATTVKLEDLGITRDQSSKCQKLASVPASMIEDYILESKQKNVDITLTGALKLLQKPDKPEIPRPQIDSLRKLRTAIQDDYPKIAIGIEYTAYGVINRLNNSEEKFSRYDVQIRSLSEKEVRSICSALNKER